jgi:hypothetical protein
MDYDPQAFGGHSERLRGLFSVPIECVQRPDNIGFFDFRERFGLF